MQVLSALEDFSSNDARFLNDRSITVNRHPDGGTRVFILSNFGELISEMFQFLHRGDPVDLTVLVVLKVLYTLSLC